MSSLCGFYCSCRIYFEICLKFYKIFVCGFMCLPLAASQWEYLISVRPTAVLSSPSPSCAWLMRLILLMNEDSLINIRFQWATVNVPDGPKLLILLRKQTRPLFCYTSSFTVFEILTPYQLKLVSFVPKRKDGKMHLVS